MELFFESTKVKLKHSDAFEKSNSFLIQKWFGIIQLRNNSEIWWFHEVPGIREIVWIGDGQHSGIVCWWKTFVANPSSFTWWISHPIHPFIILMFEASQQVLFFPSTRCSKRSVFPGGSEPTGYYAVGRTWFRRSKIRAGRNLFFEAALAEAIFFQQAWICLNDRCPKPKSWEDFAHRILVNC